MGQGRQWVRGALVAATTVALGLGMTPAAAHASSGPKIVATPSTGLVSGQTVAVKGSGFSAGLNIVGVECLNGSTDPSQCDLSNPVFVVANSHGGFKTAFVVHRTLEGEESFLNCGDSGCQLLFASADDFTDRATAQIAFDPSIPPPAPTVRTTPPNKLANHESVAIHGTGYIAGDDIEVAECLVAPFTCGPETDAIAATNGNIVTHLSLDRVLADQFGNRIDCASAPGTCEIFAFDGLDIDYHARAALKFDPSLPPPPPPTLKVAPQHQLPYYARVTMSGKNWDSNDFLELGECSDSTFTLCTTVGLAQADTAGTFSAAPMLQREVVDEFDPTSPPFDCAAPGAHCVAVAQGPDGFVTTPVTFDRAAPIPPAPSATLTPAAPYRNNQTVHVNGINFAPSASFSVAECASNDEVGTCFETGDPSDVTTATGSLTTTYQLARKLEAGPGENLDCLAGGVVCTLQISSEGGATVSVPLTFKTSASASAPPVHAARVVRTGTTGWTRVLRTRPGLPRGPLG